MAKRDRANFKATKDSRYEDNTSGGISESDSRNMFEDTADSAVFWADDVIDDDTFATASSNTVPTSESVKAYVDALAHQQNTDTHTTSDRFGIGDGNGPQKGIFIRGLAVEPEIRFNNDIGTWEVSVDGVTFIPLGYTGPKQVTTPAVTGDIQLDMSKQFMGVFRGTGILDAAGNHGIYIHPNPGEENVMAAMAAFYVQIEAGAVIAFDEYHLFSDPRFNAVSRQWTAMETGWYKMTFTWTGQHWLTEISQSVFV